MKSQPLVEKWKKLPVGRSDFLESIVIQDLQKLFDGAETFEFGGGERNMFDFLRSKILGKNKSNVKIHEGKER